MPLLTDITILVSWAGDISGLLGIIFFVIALFIALKTVRRKDRLGRIEIYFFFLCAIMELLAWSGERWVAFQQAAQINAMGTQLVTVNTKASSMQNELRDTKFAMNIHRLRDDYDKSQRKIMPDQRKGIIAALSQYGPKQKFQIFGTPGDEESRLFSGSVSQALINCGWTRDNRLPYPLISTYMEDVGIENGMMITNTTQRLNKPNVFPAAEELCRQLNLAMAVTSDYVPPDEIVVIMSPKDPNPYDNSSDDAQASHRWPPIGALRDAVLARLSRFPNQKFSVYSPQDDDAGDSLSTKIAYVLWQANWKLTNGLLSHLDYPANFGNILVEINPNEKEDSMTWAAAINFRAGLIFGGLIDASRFMPLPTNSVVPVGEIRVLIGVDPSPPLNPYVPPVLPATRPVLSTTKP